MSDLSERIDGIEVKINEFIAAQSKTNAEIMAKLDLVLSALGERIKQEDNHPVLQMTPEEYSEHLKENKKKWETLKKKRRKERSAALAASKPKRRRKLTRRIAE